VVLQCPVVTITRPQPPDIEVAVRPTPDMEVAVAWPRVRVVGDRPAPAPGVIRLAARPQGPWRLPFPQGHPLRNVVLPARRPV
jgi:hypothetical protein